MRIGFQPLLLATAGGLLARDSRTDRPVYSNSTTGRDAPLARVQLQSSRRRLGDAKLQDEHASILVHSTSSSSAALLAGAGCGMHLLCSQRGLTAIGAQHGWRAHALRCQALKSCRSAGAAIAPCGDSRVAGADSTGWLVLCRCSVEVRVLRSCANSSNTLFTFMCT